MEGDTIPPARVVDLDGLVAVLEEHGDEALLVNFWATWCGPCVEEMPHLVDLAARWDAKGARVITVSFDLMVPGSDAEEACRVVDGFFTERGWRLETLVFDGDDYDAINARLDLPGPIPVTLALAPGGTEVDRQVGAAGEERFEEMMRRAGG